MTVDPRLQLTPGEYLIHPDGSASKVVDRSNMTVDETLASGRYMDRRGRAWDYFDTRVDYDRWQRWESRGDEDLILEPDEMRLLIERDQHRAVCEGIAFCESHPVYRVVIYGPGEFVIFVPFDSIPLSERETLPEAIDSARWLAESDAARALAVGE